MYRVLIADDEPWVAYRLIRLVDWSAHGFEVCGTAQNGIEALELCNKLRPDALLSDIRMPGLDGLEMITALRKQGADVEVTLVSGYSEFAYAQRALQLGAFDYLVKQVSEQQLSELLSRLKRRLDDKCRGLDTFFSLFEEHEHLSIRERLALGAEADGFKCRFVTYTISQGEFPDLVTDHNEPDYHQLIVRTGREKVSMLVCHRTEKARTRLLGGLSGLIGCSVEAGVDSMFSVLQRQSDIAYLTGVLMGRRDEITYRADADPAYAAGLLRDIEHALDKSNASLCRELLSAMERHCEHLMLDRIEEIHTALAASFTRHKKLPPESIELMDYRRIAVEYASLSDLFESFKSALSGGGEQVDFPLSQILQVIDHQLGSDLRVAELARRFGYSTGYFGTLFTKYTGRSLTKYITAKRISHAQKLLCETDLSIQDVADQVGYGDYFQFNKAYKRHTGLTPGQYRKQHSTNSSSIFT